MGTISIGNVSRPVYGSAALAKTYFQARIGSDAYDSADQSNRNKAHVTSTNAIKAFLDRALGDAAPQPIPDPPAAPDNVQWATYEFLMAILADPTILENPDSGSNIASVGAGSAQVSFFKPTIGNAFPFPANVMRFLNAYLLEVGGPVVGLGFASGTDEKSQTPVGTNFGLTEGYR